ncbi:zeta toxin family protein [Rhizobium lentis]|uniref:zeta toxin family protein n=1 Tax=Rhizobium lentis TaxID=1138194 RepID=UPI00287FF070|nr:zeta toxin family protein [Rhizobium lentis]
MALTLNDWYEDLENLNKFLAKKRKLNPTKANKIFKRDILGSMAAENGGLKNPIFLVVGGQPAAGKTTAIRQLLDKYDPEYTVVVSENELKFFLPDNDRARMRGSHVVEEINRFVVLKWRDQLIEYAIRHRSNIILETRDTPDYILLARARYIGYKTELNIVATDRITSFTAMVSREFIVNIPSPDAKSHDLSYSGWAFIAATAVCSESFDRIAIIRRSGEIIFENKQANDPTGPMKTMQALMIARNRPLGKTHRDEIQNIWNNLERSDRFARHLPCANLPIKSYKAEIGLALNNQVDFDPYKVPVDDQRHMAEMFVRNVKRDEDFIVANLGEPYCYVSHVINRITSCHNVLQEAFLGKPAIARTGPSDSNFAPQEDTTWGTPHQEPPERSSIVKRKRADYASLVNQSPQQVSDAAKLQRPKFVVEVSPFSKRHTGAGLANDAALGGMQGEHSASAPSPSEPTFYDFTEFTEDELAGIDATADALSRSRSNAAPNLHGTRLNEAFEKKDSPSGAGLANDAALGGMQGEHSASAPSPSEPIFYDFTEFTEDELAGIDATADALSRSRSNAAPNLHGTRLNEAFEKKDSPSGAGLANDAALGGMQGEHSASAPSPSEPIFYDFTEFTEDELAGIDATADALFRSRSNAAPNLHGTRLNEAFEKKDSPSGAGLANDAALGGMQGEHSASAPSPSEPTFYDFTEFTEDELAGIDATADALFRSRSNAAPNLHETRLNEALEKKDSPSGAGLANDAALGGMNTVPSAEAQRSQASPKEFPDLTDSDLADVSELSPIDTRRAAFGTGNRRRSGPGTFYAHQARHQSVTHTVFDAEHIGDNLQVGSAPIPPWLEDEHIAADFALLGETLQRASPDIAAQTRLVEPAVAHLLRMARKPAEAAAVFHDIIDGGTASFVFLPVNNAGTGSGGTHWSLLFVDLRGRPPVAYHYDSSGTLNSAIAQGLAARLGARLDRVRMAQQDNSYDCGVFVVDATRALAARLAEGERPGSQPLHLDTLVTDRQALLDRLTAPSNARVELASSSRGRERSYGGR